MSESEQPSENVPESRRLPERPIYISREFLEPAGINGVDSYVFGKVYYESFIEGKSPYLYGELQLADCYRRITWGFAAYGAEDAKKSLEKLAKTRSLLNAFFDTLEGELRGMIPSKE